MIIGTDKIIPITQLRRRFGEVEKELPHVNRFILTKKGKPFATLTAEPSIKRDMMKKSAGAFVGTELDDDKFWREVLKKKSRSKSIIL